MFIRKDTKNSFLTIDLYVLREFLLSFAVSFLFFFFVFFVNQLLLLAENILSKHVPALDVALLLVYSLPSIVALSFPFATLVGVLMAVGQLSSQNEILAFQASGVSQARVFLPLLAVGMFFSLFSFMVNDYFLPLGSLNLNKLYMEINYSNPEIILEPYAVKKYQDSILIPGNAEEGVYETLVIIDKNENNQRRVILAENARLEKQGEQNSVLSLVLEDVLAHSATPHKQGEFDYDQAARMRYNLLFKDIDYSIHNPGPHEMSSRDVWSVIKEKREQVREKKKAKQDKVNLLRYELQGLHRQLTLEGSSGLPRIRDKMETVHRRLIREKERTVRDRSLHIWQLEFYQKFSIPFSCLPFVVLAFPLGTFSRRSGKSVGFGIGILLTVVYWGLLFAGRTLGSQSSLSPAILMWFPNLLVLAVGTILFLARRHR